MQAYEYKVVSAPRKAKRAKGARTPQDKFARTLTDVINAEAAQGWEYLRAESLPVDEKKGMLSSATETYHSVLVFRKEKSRAAEQFAAKVRREPKASPPPRAQPEVAPVAPPQQAQQQPAYPEEPPKPSPMPLGPASRGD